MMNRSVLGRCALAIANLTMVVTATGCDRLKKQDSATLGIADAEGNSKKAFGFVSVKNKLPLDVDSLNTKSDPELYWAVNAVQMRQFAFVECVSTEKMSAATWMLLLESNSLMSNVYIDQDRGVMLGAETEQGSPTKTPCQVMPGRLISYPVAKAFFVNLEGDDAMTKEELHSAQAFYLSLKAFDKPGDDSMPLSFKILQQIAQENDGITAEKANLFLKTMYAYDSDLNPCSTQNSSRLKGEKAAWRSEFYRCVPMEDKQQGKVSAYALASGRSYDAIRDGLMETIIKNHTTAYGTVTKASSARERLWSLLTRASALSTVKESDPDYAFAKALLNPDGAQAFIDAMSDAGGGLGLTGFALNQPTGARSPATGRPGVRPTARPPTNPGATRGRSVVGDANPKPSADFIRERVASYSAAGQSDAVYDATKSISAPDRLSIDLAEAKWIAANSTGAQRDTATTRVRALEGIAGKYTAEQRATLRDYTVDGNIGRDNVRLVGKDPKTGSKEWTFSNPATRTAADGKAQEQYFQKWVESPANMKVTSAFGAPEGSKVFLEKANIESNRVTGNSFVDMQSVARDGKSGTYGFAIARGDRDPQALSVRTTIKDGQSTIVPDTKNLTTVLNKEQEYYKANLDTQTKLCQDFTANKAKIDDLSGKKNAVDAAQKAYDAAKPASPEETTPEKTAAQNAAFAKLNEAKTAYGDKEATQFAELGKSNETIKLQQAGLQKESAEFHERTEKLEVKAANVTDATAEQKTALEARNQANQTAFEKTQGGVMLGNCGGAGSVGAATGGSAAKGGGALMLDDTCGGASTDAPKTDTVKAEELPKGDAPASGIAGAAAGKDDNSLASSVPDTASTPSKSADSLPPTTAGPDALTYTPGEKTLGADTKVGFTPVAAGATLGAPNGIDPSNPGGASGTVNQPILNVGNNGGFAARPTQPEFQPNANLAADNFYTQIPSGPQGAGGFGGGQGAGGFSDQNASQIPEMQTFPNNVAGFGNQAWTSGAQNAFPTPSGVQDPFAEPYGAGTVRNDDFFGNNGGNPPVLETTPESNPQGGTPAGETL